MRKPKPCSIRGVAYSSHAAAAAALGLTRQRVHQLAAQAEDGRKLRIGSKPVTIDGVTYPSTAEAADALGVSYWVARYLARSGTAARRCRRSPAANGAPPKAGHPPMRNAIKILRRTAALLESSVWIRRLPASHHCEIAKARHMLQQQADSLAELGANRIPTSPEEGVEEGMMKATWRGQVIAQSDRTLEVGGYRYFPRDSVRMDLLQVTPKTESDLECPHGVQFYDVAENGMRSERAAWSYLAPRASMKQVDHWIGFWDDVEIK